MAVTRTKKEQAALAEMERRRQQEEAERDERIRTRRLLGETQPYAYTFFERSLKNGTLAHGYLLYGAKNAMKEEMALLLAESILLDCKDGLIIEEERTPEEGVRIRQMVNQTARSLICLDGRREKAITKEEVDAVQRRFSHTTTEQNGRRVWMMTGCENASRGAQNSLLKFLEEPAADVYAVLCTDAIDQVLPTIRSRCITVPFRPLSASYLYEQALRQGLDEEDAFFLSTCGLTPIALTSAAASLPYQRAKTMFRQWCGPSRWSLAADFDVRHRFKSGQEGVNADLKTMNMELLRYFFSFLAEFCRRVLGESDGKEPAWYHKAVERAEKEADAYARYRTVRRIAWEENDRVNRRNDLSLLFDQTFDRLEDIHG